MGPREEIEVEEISIEDSMDYIIIRRKDIIIMMTQSNKGKWLSLFCFQE